jgi:hypothetical protein
MLVPSLLHGKSTDSIRAGIDLNKSSCHNRGPEAIDFRNQPRAVRRLVVEASKPQALKKSLTTVATRSICESVSSG